MPINLRPLQYFVVLAEELSFSRAAERLHVAQPALSQQIRGLEKRLGAVLVDRARRPLRLTEAGHYLHAEARQILASYEEAARGTREIGLGIRGWLAIGFTRWSMYIVLPPALSRSPPTSGARSCTSATIWGRCAAPTRSRAAPAGTACPTPSTSTCATRTDIASRSTPTTTTPVTPTTR